MVIKGYGVYAYERNLQSLSKMTALLENTCKILYFNSLLEGSRQTQNLFEI